MIKIEQIATYGWDAAIRGMRNPMNSWDKSDSRIFHGKAIIGENDRTLMEKLSHGGPVHGKFLRMITVTMDITAPLYWWKEFDTYKVGTVANSCSTMHKLASSELTINDFSHEHLTNESRVALHTVIQAVNHNRELFNKTKDKKYWWQMIQLLPSSYNQKRTVQFNYQVAKDIWQYRHDHKLDEWHDLCKVISKLPYAKELEIVE